MPRKSAPAENSDSESNNNSSSEDEREEAPSKLSHKALLEELERLKVENSNLKKAAKSDTIMRVSEKGALSVYGMGRYPVTLYASQWMKLLDKTDDIKSFIEKNKDRLAMNAINNSNKSS
jgi:hypothetical protein